VADTTREMGRQSEIFRGLGEASGKVEGVIDDTTRWVGDVTDMVKRTAQVSGQVKQGVEHIVGQISRIRESAQASAREASDIIGNADRMARLGEELDNRLARFQT